MVAITAPVHKHFHNAMYKKVHLLLVEINVTVWNINTNISELHFSAHFSLCDFLLPYQPLLPLQLQLVIMIFQIKFVMGAKVTPSNLCLPRLQLHCYARPSTPHPLVSGQPYWLRQARLTEKRCWSEKWGSGGRRWEENSGRKGGIRVQRGGTEGWVPERQRGWEAKGKERRERECRIQIERKFCNVTVFKLLCCLSDKSHPSKTNAAWRGTNSIPWQTDSRQGEKVMMNEQMQQLHR